jgi:hypothetical protein
MGLKGGIEGRMRALTSSFINLSGPRLNSNLMSPSKGKQGIEKGEVRARMHLHLPLLVSLCSPFPR